MADVDFLATNLTFHELFISSGNRLLDFLAISRVLFVFISILISMILRLKFEIMGSNTHFNRLFTISEIVFIVFAVSWTATVFALLNLEKYRMWFMFFMVVFLVTIQTLSALIQPFCSVFMLSYAVSFLFQKEETLKNSITSKEGKLIVWFVGFSYALWCHPLNGYNVVQMFFVVEDSMFKVHNINPLDAIFLILTTAALCAKYVNVCRYPKTLSTVELANLLHITLMLLFEMIFVAYEITLLLLSNNTMKKPFQHIEGSRMGGIWSFYGTVAPFLYPYSTMLTIVFFDTNTRIRYSRRLNEFKPVHHYHRILVYTLRASIILFMVRFVLEKATIDGHFRIVPIIALIMCFILAHGVFPFFCTSILVFTYFYAGFLFTPATDNFCGCQYKKYSIIWLFSISISSFSNFYALVINFEYGSFVSLPPFIIEIEVRGTKFHLNIIDCSIYLMSTVVLIGKIIYAKVRKTVITSVEMKRFLTVLFVIVFIPIFKLFDVFYKLIKHNVEREQIDISFTLSDSLVLPYICTYSIYASKATFVERFIKSEVPKPRSDIPMI